MEFIRIYIYDGIAYGNLLQFAIEHGHRNSGFTHEKMWFSIVFCMFTRGYIVWSPGNQTWLGNPRTVMEVSFAISNKNMMLVGGWPTPLKNMSSSVGMMKFPIWWKVIKFHGSKPPTRMGVSSNGADYWRVSPSPHCGAGGSIISQYYPLVNIQKNYWKWPFIVDLPLKNGDFP